MRVVRNLNVPLQNGGVAIFPVLMTPVDYALLTTILEGLKGIHVVEESLATAEAANVEAEPLTRPES